MGCCNSLKFEPTDIELSLPDPNPRIPPRDADGFADVSLDSHSESNPGDALETHPVFLMNSVIVQSPVKLYKQRSITVSGPPRGGRTLEEVLRDESLQSELALRSNPRSISYSSVSVGGLLVVRGMAGPPTEAVRSTRASAASSFHEGHEAAKKLD